MNTKEITEYLNRINNSQNKEEQLEITRNFLEIFSNALIKEESEKSVRINLENKDIIMQCVDSGALEKMFDIGVSDIPELARKCIIAVHLLDESRDKSYYIEKFTKSIGNILESNYLLDENEKIKDFDFYDTILTQYFYLHTDNNIPINDTAKMAFEILKRNLPDGIEIKDTKVYKKQCMHNLDKKEILDIIPRPPIEEYKQKLSELLDENGKPKDIKELDEILYQFLMLYEINDSELEGIEMSYIEKLIQNSEKGKLTDLKTYSKFICEHYDDFCVSCILRENMNFIIKDILIRMHESGNKEKIKCFDFEQKFYIDYFADGYINDKGKEIEIDELINELIDNGTAQNYSEGCKIVMSKLELEKTHLLKGDLRKYIENLNAYTDKSSIEIAQYLIRIKNTYKDGNRPTNDNLGKIYDHIQNIDIVNLLKKNLNPEEIKQGNPQYIDCADTALKLICECDIKEAMNLFTNREIYEAFKNCGINIYETEAMKKFVEIYVDNPEMHEDFIKMPQDLIIENYIRYKASKPNFNILEDQGLSDILQLCQLGGTMQAQNFMDTLISSMQNSKKLNMASEAERIGNSFIKQFENKAITEENEEQFSKFIDALTTLKIKNRWMLDSKYIDFILSQALRKNSIINMNRDKYNFLVERALEDLGKQDFIRQNDGEFPTYLYCIRDYLDKDATTGMHSIRAGSKTIMKSVKLKRDRIESIYDAKFDLINTIFHENQHMNQNLSFSRLPKNFYRYNMIKEEIIRNNMPRYYQDNYKYMYIEIEAREKRSRKSSRLYIKNFTNRKY